LEDTSKKSDTRVNDIFFGPLERPALQWLCAHMPAWVTPDILTAIGVLGGLLITLGYWLSNYDKNFLWLSDFGFVVNWFGDSLDGSLARYRQIERFKYGYFIDHTVDTVTQTMICVGLGVSPFVDFNYAMLALVGYLQLGILAYVNNAVTGVFKLSYGKIGPTEIRVIIVCANAIFYFANDPLLNLSFMKISFFNLIVLAVAAGFFLYFLIFAYLQGREFARQDPPKSRVAG
jgi:phosphatidylglycerophosphate synthase